MIGLGGAADDFNLMDGAPLLLCLTVLQAAFVCSLLIFLASFGSGAVGFDDELQESGGVYDSSPMQNDTMRGL